MPENCDSRRTIYEYRVEYFRFGYWQFFCSTSDLVMAETAAFECSEMYGPTKITEFSKKVIKEL